jgi:deoxyribonuclease V
MTLPLDDWNLTVSEAIARQRALRDSVVLEPPPDFSPRLVAGADLSMSRGSDRGVAGIVVIDAATLETVDEAVATVDIRFPYVPGLLSFRELPTILSAWAQLATRPDVLIFDGQGYAHPRRFGIACHGGVLLDLPTIGCAKSILVGTHRPLGVERGARADLVHGGETVGVALRLRDGVAPVYVSPGHRMDVETAVRVVLSMSTGYREPETTRRAHRLVNTVRSGSGL